MSELTSDGPYAECLVCHIPLQTPQDRDAHVEATWEPVVGPQRAGVGNVRRAHAYQVLNPTPEERAQRLVDREVDDAVTACIDELSRQVNRGRITEEQVTQAIRRYAEFDDAWDEYVREGLEEGRG